MRTSRRPTAGSVILAGVLLKMGTYGFVRFAFPLFPLAATFFAPLPRDARRGRNHLWRARRDGAAGSQEARRLLDRSAISGFVVLGIAAMNTQGVQGAVYQMLSHGVSTGGLFLIVGMLSDLRRHTRMISEFGGLWHSVPVYAGIFMVVMLSSAGLPGLNGFVGEFLILVGAYLHTWQAAVVAVSGLILGALYLFYAYERVMFGPITKDANKTLPDLSGREIAVMAPLLALMFLMGFFPRPLLNRIEPSVMALLQRTHTHIARIDSRHPTAAMLAAATKADKLR